MPFTEDRNAAFAKLAERAAQANMTPAERADYEESLRNCRDYYSTIDSAVEMGENRGLAKGLAQGVEITQRKTVAKMYAKGYSAAEIADCTDLTEEEVTKIIQTLS